MNTIRHQAKLPSNVTILIKMTVAQLLHMFISPSDKQFGVFVYLFVLRFLRPSQPHGVMLRAVNLPNHTLTGQALSSKRLTSIVNILSPEVDNCPS